MLMLSTLMLPNAILIIPRYLLFNRFGWLNTYLPFYIPALFACYPFFIYMMVQFFRGIPKDFDEAATIDGCNSFQVFCQILLPLCKPALFSAAIFQFIWTWNDFFNIPARWQKVSSLPRTSSGAKNTATSTRFPVSPTSSPNTSTPFRTRVCSRPSKKLLKHNSIH